MSGPGSESGRRPRIVLDGRKARDFGIGRYVTGLAAGLAALGEFDLTVLVLPEDEPLFPEGVATFRCDAPHYSLAELFLVRRDAAQLSPDLFHAPHYVLPFFPPRPVVVTIHDLMHLTRPEHASPPRRLYARWMLGRAARIASRVLTVSGASRDEIEKLLPAARGKTSVVPNGLGGEFLAPVPQAARERVRARYGLGGSRYVLFLGNDKPHKNLDGLLEAWAEIRRAGAAPGVRLVLAGGAAGRREARRSAARARGLVLGGGEGEGRGEDDVLDLGVVEEWDVAPLLASAEALAFPSLAEGFGLPPLEAQAVGTPVLASRRGGLAEAVGEAALFVDPTSPREIAAGLVRLLSEEDLRRRLSAEGSGRARAFTWEAAARRTSEVYRELLAAAGRSRGKG